MRVDAGAASDARNHYRTIFESAVDFAIIATNSDGRVIEWNAGAEHILGWSATEMRGEHIDRIFTAEDRAEGRSGLEMRRAVAEGRANDERWHVRKSGVRFWARGEMMPLQSENDAHIGFIKILRDRTAEHEAATALRESEAYLRLVLDSAVEGLYGVDCDGVTTFCNVAFLRMLGFAREEDAIGRKLHDVIHYSHTDGSHYDKADCPIYQAAQSGQEQHVEGELFFRLDGTSFPVEYWVRPIVYEGALQGAACTFVDLTERNRTEASIAEAHAAAEKLAAERSAILGQLVEGVIVADSAGRIVFINDAAAELHGVRELGIEPDRYSDTYHLLTEAGTPYPPHDLPLARALRGETVIDARWRIRRSDGAEVLAIGSARPIEQPDGTRGGAVLTLRDDTARKAAETERSRLAAIVEQSRDFIGVADSEGRTIFLNEAGRALVGLKHLEAALDAHVESYFQPEDQSTLRNIALPAVERDGYWEGELHFRNFATGASIPVLYNIFPVRDADGDIVGYGTVTRDLTERERAEDALREETRRLETLNRTGAAIAAELDLERVVQGVTDAGVDLTGAQVGAFFYNVLNEAGESYMLYTLSGVHRSAFESFPMPRATAVFRPTFHGERVVRSDDILADPRYGHSAPHYGMPKGHLPVRSYLSVPVISRSGEVIGGLFFGHPEPGRFSEQHERLMLGIAAQAAVAIDNARLYQTAQREIEERRRAEGGLVELTQTLEARVAERTAERDRTWRLSQDLLAVVETDGVIASVNRAFTELLGWDVGELIGIRFLEITHPDEIDVTFAVFQGIFEAPLVNPYQFRLRHKDGTYRWFAWTGAFEDGRVYANGRHTTFEHEQAEALARAEEHLRQSQKMEAVGQLAAGIAHDFNNLLAGISGSLELLQTRMSQGRLTELDRYIAAAQGAAKRAAALTHRLLAFSRRQTLDPKPTNVNRLVTSMEELIRRTMGPPVEIEVVGAAGLWTTLIDPSQLENALLNLCINARDAMPDGGRLTIETANKWLDERAARERELPPGQYISLCVTDTGTGMTPGVIARVFDPFFTTKPIGMGTGLGLSMVYGFARQSGGQVRIYSEIGRGTTMCIYLPRHYGQEDEAECGADPTEAPRLEPDKTVLVVDDEPTVRMLVTEIVEDLGYTAIETADGASGLRVLQSAVRIDLLITDVGLPGGMNGRQVADAGRTMRPGLKVLFITGYAENAVVGNGHLEPSMQVLTKPFTMEALASRIKELTAAA
ncbi:MAG: PAS domain S-box protein [Proteobacteria bacterium]|nr:PAS domain S-box protein [Pseudomonadota bacterium]